MPRLLIAVLLVMASACSAATEVTETTTQELPSTSSAVANSPASTTPVPIPPSSDPAGTVATLFGDSPPPAVYVDTGSSLFVVDEAGSAELPVDGPVFSIAGDWIAGAEFITSIETPDEPVAYGCPDVFRRGDQIIVSDWCLGPNLRLIDADTGEELAVPRFPALAGEDIIGYWFAEAAETQVIATIDAEGNLSSATANGGIDVAGKDYPGVASLSTDGALFIYGDHSQSPSPHFTDTVKVKDTADGSVVGTWTVPGVVRGIQSDGTWLLITEIEEEDAINGVDTIVATTAILLATGSETRVESPHELFLPH